MPPSHPTRTVEDVLQKECSVAESKEPKDRIGQFLKTCNAIHGPNVPESPPSQSNVIQRDQKLSVTATRLKQYPL